MELSSKKKGEAQHPKDTSEDILYGAAGSVDPTCEEITIPESSAPLVVLFGPHACGKTMTMVRLLRFLIQEGFDVKAVHTFRPVLDRTYTEVCDGLHDTIRSDHALPATDISHSMLVEVAVNKHVVSHILDAPGVCYFDKDNPWAPLSDFASTIINSSNRKIWAIMIEPQTDYMDDLDRVHYVANVARLKQYMWIGDRVIFLFNKIDRTNFVRGVGGVDAVVAFKTAESLYPNIFDSFKNTYWLTRLFRKYNFEFVPFQTGCFAQTSDDLVYHEGPMEYCVNLWNAIIK